MRNLILSIADGLENAGVRTTFFDELHAAGRVGIVCHRGDFRGTLGQIGLPVLVVSCSDDEHVRIVGDLVSRGDGSDVFERILDETIDADNHLLGAKLTISASQWVTAVKAFADADLLPVFPARRKR